MKLARTALTSLLFAALCAGAGHIRAATLEVEVSGLPTQDGMVMIAVYDNAEAWMKKAVRGMMAKPLEGGKAVLRVENLPDGEYAISLLHDANGNNKMDFNVLGIPTEAFGFSNNASGSFGPPKFEAARFTVKGDTVHRISIN